MTPEQNDSTVRSIRQATSLQADADREISVLNRAQQRVQPGSVEDQAIAARRQALESVPGADRAHAAIWRQVTGL